MNSFLLALGAAGAALALTFYLFFLVLRQNGRLLLRVENLEEQLAAMAGAWANLEAARGGRHPLSTSKIPRDGLPKGTPAPDFRLPRLEGGELALSAYRGRKVLLVFSDPHCGPCNVLAPLLEKAARQRPDVQVLMVSRGEAADNRRKVQEHRLSFPIVLQRKWEVSKLYAMFATPVGYLINAEGVTASEVGVGGEAILGLLSGSAAGVAEKEVVSVW
jgi:peroxiredoxin